MKNANKIVSIGWYQKKAHEEVDYIFEELMPKQGFTVREEQLRLSHEMLDTLWEDQIALCDAGVGIGKTYAYLVACIMKEKYSRKVGMNERSESHPAVISTSSIALQDAILQEYIPFLSRLLLEGKLIRKLLKAVIRKGKEHFVCDSRLNQRIVSIRDKKKNGNQKKALLALRTCFDMDQVHGLSGFDRRLVCVPKFCPKNCPEKESCRYRRYMKRVKSTGIHFQICNHNYLLADASHRTKGYSPLLSDYRVLVIDEAHKLPEAAVQGECFQMDPQPARRSREGSLLFFNPRQEVHFIPGAGFRKTSGFLRHQPGGSGVSSECIMEPGDSCSPHQRNFKGREWLPANPADVGLE